MTVQEQKRRKKKQDVFQWAKEELYKAAELFTKRKSEIILETAKKLEDLGIEKSTISTEIANGLQGFITHEYVTIVLKDHPEYKNKEQSKRGKGNKKKSGLNSSTESSQTEQSPEQKLTHKQTKNEIVQEYENSTDDAPTGIYQMKVEEFKIEDIHLYDRTFLIQIIKYLYEKMGQSK